MNHTFYWFNGQLKPLGKKRFRVLINFPVNRENVWFIVCLFI